MYCKIAKIQADLVEKNGKPIAAGDDKDHLVVQGRRNHDEVSEQSHVIGRIRSVNPATEDYTPGIALLTFMMKILGRDHRRRLKIQ